jgi:hypothetical protein
MSERFEPPEERWSRDSRELLHVSADELERAFVVYFHRTVTNDRTVPIDGKDYEVPKKLAPSGRRGKTVRIMHRLLSDTYHVVCEGRLVQINPVDLAANARSPRAQRSDAENEPEQPPTKTAADMTFERELGAVGDDDGNVFDHVPDDEKEEMP